MSYDTLFLERKVLKGISMSCTSDMAKTGAISSLWNKYCEKVDCERSEACFGVSSDFNPLTGEFFYFAGTETYNAVKDMDNTEEFIIPGGRYARFKSKDCKSLEDMIKLIKESFVELAESDLLDYNRSIDSFELYDKDYKGFGEERSIFYIYYPIK